MKGVRQKTKDSYEITVYDKRNGGTCHIYYDKQGRRFTELRYAIGVRGKILDEIRERTFDPGHYKPQKAVHYQFDTAIWEWLAEHELAPSTRREYKNKIKKHFIPHFKNANVADITARDIKALKMSNTVRSILKAFYTSLFHDEVIKRIPNFPPRKKTPKRERRVCTWEVFVDIVDAIPSRTVRDACITTRLEWLRPSETRALKWEDFEWEAGSVIIRSSFSGAVFRETTKSGEEGKVHLHSLVREMLEPRKGHPKAFVFTTKHGKPFYESKLRYEFNRAKKAKGYSEELDFYGATRHSGATQGYRDTGDIHAVQRGLRHKDLKATLHYTHEDDTKCVMEPKGDVIEIKKEE